MSEPFFDIVDVEFSRDDLWALFLSLFGIRMVRRIPQMVWRPGGRERFAEAMRRMAK